MSSPRPLKVFVLGSFRDIHVPGTVSKAVLWRLVASLRKAGWDAFTSGDARSLQVAGTSHSPKRMTEVLEPMCDLAIYVGVRVGRGDGWVSEITAMQLLLPDGASKRVVLLEAGYPLTSLLDPLQEGYLAHPPVMIGVWSDENELLELARRCALHMASKGRLPPVL